MKKTFFRILILCLLCMIFLNFSTVLAYDDIKAIDMYLYINNDGSVDITEIWECEGIEGTELSHHFYDFTNERITKVSVSESGEEYKVLSNWESTLSRDQKIKTCAIKKVGNDVGIYWGIDGSGEKEFIVNYTIENFVKKLDMFQMVYFTLLPKERDYIIERAMASIYVRDREFDKNVLIWSLGETNSKTEFSKKHIEMYSGGSLDPNECMMILAKFPLDYFNNNNIQSHNFEYYYQLAIKDMPFNMFNMKIPKANFEGDSNLLKYFLMAALYISYAWILPKVWEGILNLLAKKPSAFYGIILIMIIVFAFSGSFNLLLVVSLLFVAANFSMIMPRRIIKENILENNCNYYREIPCNGDIFKVYYIAYQYDLIKNETDLLAAVFLKWLKEGRISLSDRSNDNENDYSIKLVSYYEDFEWKNPRELALYQFIYRGSEKGILTKNKFISMCRKKYDYLTSWFNSIANDVQEELIEENQLILKQARMGNSYIASPKMLNNGKQICGLIKYFNNFSTAEGVEAMNTDLLEDYLIMMQVLGMGKETARLFDQYYTKRFADGPIKYGNYLFIESISSATIKSAITASTIFNAKNVMRK